MRQRFIRRRGPRPEDAPPPEPYQPTPEEAEHSRKVHAQLALDQAAYLRRVAAGEVQPHQVLEQIRTLD